MSRFAKCLLIMLPKTKTKKTFEKSVELAKKRGAHKKAWNARENVKGAEKNVVPRHWCLKRKSNRTNRNIEILPKDSKDDHKCTQTLLNFVPSFSANIIIIFDQS